MALLFRAVYIGTRPGVSPVIRAGKGWRGRRELAPRCSATQLGACSMRSYRQRHVRYTIVRTTTTTTTTTGSDRLRELCFSVFCTMMVDPSGRPLSSLARFSQACNAHVYSSHDPRIKIKQHIVAVLRTCAEHFFGSGLVPSLLCTFFPFRVLVDCLACIAVQDTMGAKMITNRVFFRPPNSGQNNQDPAKDPRIPENGHKDFLSGKVFGVLNLLIFRVFSTSFLVPPAGTR